jgi:tensin
LHHLFARHSKVAAFKCINIKNINFIVHSILDAFGLVVRVAQPPPGSKGGIDELVRHFLVEPTVRGVRLKGCSNEPVFSSLSALIYQHSVTPLALPCRLLLPERDIQQSFIQTSAQQQLAVQGAACNVLYLFSADTESLTGPQAVRKAVRILFERRPLPTPTEVHFKVSQQGITLTDNSRQLFFRKHYPGNTITYIGMDPDDHRWSVQVTNADIPVKNHQIFAFVAKKTAVSTDNQCHIFCELESRQPASAITSFGQKVLLDEATLNQHAPAQI